MLRHRVHLFFPAVSLAEAQSAWNVSRPPPPCRAYWMPRRWRVYAIMSCASQAVIPANVAENFNTYGSSTQYDAQARLWTSFFAKPSTPSTRQLHGLQAMVLLAYAAAARGEAENARRHLDHVHSLASAVAQPSCDENQQGWPACCGCFRCCRCWWTVCRVGSDRWSISRARQRLRAAAPQILRANLPSWHRCAVPLARSAARWSSSSPLLRARRQQSKEWWSRKACWNRGTIGFRSPSDRLPVRKASRFRQRLVASRLYRYSTPDCGCTSHYCTVKTRQVASRMRLDACSWPCTHCAHPTRYCDSYRQARGLRSICSATPWPLRLYSSAS